MLLGNVFVNGTFESYIVQCESNVEVCIFTKIQ